MLLGQFNGIARIGILTEGTGRGFRILGFQFCRGHTRIVAAEFVEVSGQRRIMTGVGE
jgi:hypothetical protein